MFPLRDSRPAESYSIITNLIILVNILVFFFEMTQADTGVFFETYALIPSRVNFTNYLTLIPFITSQFLHAGFIHILSNMWFLKIFGDNVEERFGHLTFLLVYLFSGVVGGLVQYFITPQATIPMLGASGAVAGILGAYLVFFPGNRIESLVPLGLFITTVDIPASVMLIYWFITQLFSGVGSIAVAQIGGVAFWAHIGGFISGFIIANIWGKSDTVEDGAILN